MVGEDSADLEAVLQQALATPTGADGKHGAAIVVQLTDAVSRDGGDRPGPYLDDVTIVLRCVEARLINRDTTSGGTGLSALEIAERAAAIVAQEAPTAGSPPWYVESIRLAELPPESGLVGYDVTVRTVTGLAVEET